jgi:preprotein translocase subunit SecD
VDENNQPAVHFTLTPQGADRFRRETGRNVGKRLAIILDGSVASAPTIQSQIGSEGVITGRFTTQEADELSKVLRAGALPASLKYQQELTVGASLGRDSIRAGVTAALMGMAFLAIFMLAYYRLSGLNAIVALTANLVILLGGMAYIGSTLTLPGIAGIILTIGVGVDTNVLVFERIREELRAGRAPRSAIEAGFQHAMPAIIDTNVTTFLSGVILFQFGTGPIKGFAVTLCVGILTTVVTAVYMTRIYYDYRAMTGKLKKISI